MPRADQTIIAGRYEVSPRTLCFLTYDDHVLLLRGAPDKRVWPDQYNGVGGHVRPNEDIHSAALREIYEETGLGVSDLSLRGVINVSLAGSGKGILLFVFTAEAKARTVRSSPEGTPIWVPLDELDRLNLVEDLPLLLPRVLSMDSADPPFFALYTYDQDDRLIVSFAPTTS